MDAPDGVLVPPEGLELGAAHLVPEIELRVGGTHQDVAGTNSHRHDGVVVGQPGNVGCRN